MKLSEQVCALEQAKKLYALGVERRSLFYHFHGRIEHEAFGSEYYSAFTVAELGVMLPMQVTSGKYDLKGGYGVSVISPLCFAMDDAEDAGNKFNWGRYATEAEARAAMLIYLLENNLVTPAEINQRLTQK